MKYIATISGGKDSTAMCDLLLKKGFPVDYIVFNDTTDEFDEMYEYLDKVEEYFLTRYNKKITRLKPVKNYDDYIFRVLSRGENVGSVAGLPNGVQGFCEWRRDAKIRPFERWIKAEKIGEHKIYMGITLDEAHRTDRNSNFLYPLIDDFMLSEENCKAYLINQEMENPLYKHFSRTGCRKCQFQSDRDFFNIWKHYPKVWQEFADYESKVRELKMNGASVVSESWFTDHRTCLDMETKFIKTDKQGSLFDFSNEPLKDCFCKI